MRKCERISTDKNRVVVSEILPYELPLFFSNRYFVRFLIYYGIKAENGQLVATKHVCEGLDELLRVLGGSPGDRRPAFQYEIKRNINESNRLLTIIHPYHQVQMVEFYNKFKTVIIDFCCRSCFSIRYPYKIATRFRKLEGIPKFISEIEAKENIDSYNDINHFFVYKHYQNINEFFCDYRFLCVEKKFLLMYKSDIKKCFDNIKPEMLSKAMFELEINDALGSMPQQFYELNKSYENKEKGIVIGPEFSRIYAEIILQKIDVDTELKLQHDGVLLNRDYVFFRYVDDGFLFCNDKNVAEKFYAVYESCLHEYNLELKSQDEKEDGQKENNVKYMEYNQRPFLQNINACKEALKNLVIQKLDNRLENFIGFCNLQEGIYDSPTNIDYRQFICSVRVIMGTFNTEYKNVMSYLLGCIKNSLLKLLKQFDELYRQYKHADYVGEINQKGEDIKIKYENDFIRFSVNLIEILFYLFFCDMRMSTSIKIVGLIHILQLFVRGKYLFEDNNMYSCKFSTLQIAKLDESISENTVTALEMLQSGIDNKKSNGNVLEILNLLELQKSMTYSTQIQPDYFKKIIYKNLKSYNFLNILQILHFINNDKRYEELKYHIISIINKILSSKNKNNISDTEVVFTFFEIISCPWFNKDEKKKFCDLMNIKNIEALLKFSEKQKDMFVKWHSYKLFDAYQYSNSLEVY